MLDDQFMHRHAVSLLNEAWRDSFSARRMEVYVEHLADLDGEAVLAAVNLLVKSSQFPPTVSEIRTVVATARTNYPTPGVALELTERAVMEGKTRQLPAPARRALDLLGGSYSWKTTETPSIMRSQFLRLYEEFARAETQAIIAGQLESGRRQLEGGSDGND